MEFWETLWKITFICSISCFALMAVWVSIWGAFDIKKMLQTLKNEHETGATEPPQDD